MGDGSCVGFELEVLGEPQDRPLLFGELDPRGVSSIMGVTVLKLVLPPKGGAEGEDICEN